MASTSKEVATFIGSECPSSCAVCGASADTLHYGVPACCGCKHFFRRAILQQRAYVCENDGDCMTRPLPSGTKRVCRACRGPRRSYIVETNIIIPHEPTVVEVLIERMTAALLRIEYAYDSIRKSAHNLNPEFPEQVSLDNCLGVHSLLARNYGDMPGWPLESLPELENVPSAEDRVRNRQAMINLKPLFPIFKNRKFWMVLDLFYAVEYIKTHAFFNALSYQDKRLVAARAALMLNNFTRSFYSVERGSVIAVYPDGTNPPSLNSPFEHLTYVVHVGLVKDLDLDRSEYTLLKALFVANPAIEGLSEAGQGILGKEQQKLGKALFSHVLARRGVKEGPKAYVAMMAYTDTLLHLTKKMKELFAAHHSLGLLSSMPDTPLLFDVHWK